MEGGMVAKGAEEQLQALRFDDRLGGRIIDDQMREIGLAGDRTQRREFGRREADEIKRAGTRVRDIIQFGGVGRRGQGAGLAKMLRAHGAGLLAAPAPRRYPRVTRRRMVWTTWFRPTGYSATWAPRISRSSIRPSSFPAPAATRPRNSRRRIFPARVSSTFRRSRTPTTPPRTCCQAPRTSAGR